MRRVQIHPKVPHNFLFFKALLPRLLYPPSTVLTTIDVLFGFVVFEFEDIDEGVLFSLDEKSSPCFPFFASFKAFHLEEWLTIMESDDVEEDFDCLGHPAVVNTPCDAGCEVEL